MGIGQGIVNAADRFGESFSRAKGAQDALAQKAAELTATQKHQQRLEDLQAQAIASQEKIAGDKMDYRYVAAGDAAGVAARNPLSPEETALQNERDATIARRTQAGSEAVTGMSEANAFNRIGQTPLAPRMGEEEYSGQFKGDPVLGFEDTLPTSSEPPVRFSGVNAATGGGMQPVQPSARPTASAQGEALAKAAAGVRERKNADDELKATVELQKQESKQIADEIVANIRAKGSVDAANASNQAARAMAALANRQYGDFKKSVETFQMVNAETGKTYNPFLNADGTANYELGKSTFELFSKPASATASLGGMKEGLKPLQDEVDQLNKNIGEMERDEAWVSSPNGQKIIDDMKARRDVVTRRIQSGASVAPMGGGVGSFNPVANQRPPQNLGTTKGGKPIDEAAVKYVMDKKKVDRTTAINELRNRP